MAMMSVSRSFQLSFSIICLICLLQPVAVWAGVLVIQVRDSTLASCPANNAIPTFQTDIATFIPTNKCLADGRNSIRYSCTGGAQNKLVIAAYSDPLCTQEIEKERANFTISEGCAVVSDGADSNLVWLNCGSNDLPDILFRNDHLEVSSDLRQCPADQTGALVSIIPGRIMFASSTTGGLRKLNCSSRNFLDTYNLEIKSDGSANLQTCVDDGTVETRDLPATKSCDVRPVFFAQVPNLYQVFISHKGLSGGAIAGIVIGALAVVGLLVFAGYKRGWWPCCGAKPEAEADVGQQHYAPMSDR